MTKCIATSASLAVLLMVCDIGLVLSLKCDPNTEQTCSATCNGTNYDITKLIDGRTISDLSNGKVYDFVFSCKGIPCGNDNISSAVCQKETDGDKRSWSCGQAEGAIWSVQSTNPLTLAVVYSKGDKQSKGHIRRTRIVLTVGSKDKFLFNGEEDSTATYNFNFNVSSVSKLHSSSSGGIAPGIIGWVLICVGLISFVTYFIVGAIVMVVVKDARGVDIIPNFEFWKNFPFLLKDGVALTLTPCLLLANRKKAGYENI